MMIPMNEVARGAREFEAGEVFGSPSPSPSSARDTVNEMVAAGLLDEVMAKVTSGQFALDGPGGFLPEMIKAALERGLGVELTDHLGYEHSDRAGHGSGNSRNGTTPKTVASTVGDVGLDVPRDRAGTFTPTLVPKGARRIGGLDEVIISLYAGGMTVRDIEAHLARTIGTELSRETISKITDPVLDEVTAWQSRPLEEIYPIIYLDALVVKIREGHTVRNRAAHIAIGVDLDGVKHVLGIWVQAAEGAKFWGGVCAELRNRGVRDVLIVCCDGLTGFPEAIEATWPQATVQTCTVHLIRAAMRFVSYADRKKVAAALRPIYTAPTADIAETELLAFAESDLGVKYPAAVRTWANELKGRGIRVNAVSPGSTDTPGIAGLFGEENAADVKVQLAAGVPLGRMGRPEEVAAAVVFLASSQSSFILGANLYVDGGENQI